MQELLLVSRRHMVGATLAHPKRPTMRGGRGGVVVGQVESQRDDKMTEPRWCVHTVAGGNHHPKSRVALFSSASYRCFFGIWTTQIRFILEFKAVQRSVFASTMSSIVRWLLFFSSSSWCYFSASSNAQIRFISALSSELSKSMHLFTPCEATFSNSSLCNFCSSVSQ